MAISVSAPFNGLDFLNRHKANFVVVTLDNSYPTGGYAFDWHSSQGGLTSLLFMDIQPRAGVAGDGVFYQYDPVNLKIKAFGDSGGAAGSKFGELSNATDLSTVVLDIWIVGT